MATKQQLIAGLSEHTLAHLTEDYSKWTSFLKTAANNYKYPFHDQVLIFAQRPGATACAEIEQWNKYFGRWVNKGAKGIALLEAGVNGYKLRHVFDIADTHDRYNHPLNIWQMEEKYSQAVMESLENAFGEPSNNRNLAMALISAAENAVEDNLSDYLSELLSVKDSSLLEELDDINISAILQNTMKASVSYMLLSRCGIYPEIYIGPDDLKYITDFNTPESISVLGSGSGAVADLILQTIGRTIKTQQLEEAKQIRTFANRDKKQDNVPENTFKERMEPNERDESDLPDAGRLSSAGTETAGDRDDGSTGQVRENASELFENSSETGIQPPDAVGQADTALPGDRNNSEGTTEYAYGKDGQDAGSERNAQSQRPDTLDRTDELHQSVGGGDHTDRADLQLEFHDRNTERRDLRFFGNTATINELIRTTPYLNATKEQIMTFFQENEDYKARVDFIRSIWNNDQTEFEISDGRVVGYKTYLNVLHMWEGSFKNRTAESYYDWSVIASHILGMILLREYSDTQIPVLPIEEQMQIGSEAEADKAPAFVFSEELIDAVLCRGSGMSDGKLRIYEQFQKNESQKDNERFLFHEYGTGGACPILSGTDIDEMHDGKGITLWRGGMDSDAKITINWSRAAKRIGELIVSDRYLTCKEKERYPAYIAERQEEARRFEEEKLAREILSHKPEQEDIEPEQHEYHLGDSVFIGTGDYEILSFDEDKVTLYDKQFPLLNKELPRDEFDRKVTENPANDHLKKPVVQYDTGFGELGNGITVWNRLQEEQGDYKTIAHINEDGSVTYYENIPIEIKSRIEEYAESIDITASINEELPESETVLENVKTPVGSIDFLFSGEVSFYFDEDQFVSTVKEQNWHGVPMSLKVFRDPVTGQHINIDFIYQLDPPPQGFEITDYAPAQQPEIAEISEPVLVQPEISQQRINYHITDDRLGYGGPKEKFGANVAAIRLMQRLESDDRFATPEEQSVLAKYVGWGGLPDAFDQNKWPDEYLLLKSLLDEQEYAAARESTLTAFFTPPVVIKAIYQAIENSGFKAGNILEPSCGTGNFFGLLPETLSGSKLYGIELDSITGRIAKQLYQQSDIKVQGYEKTELPDSFFDVAVGNVPFGQFKVGDKRYDKHSFLIHDYFFAKTLDKVRPGGIIAFITSKGTLDKENPTVRKYIAQRAELLGAIRLPDNTFSKNAGTDVTSDIIFLQKRDRLIEQDFDWVHLGKDENGITMNQYFVDNPDMILGEMVMESTQFGMDSTCKAFDNADLETMLSDAIININAEINDYENDFSEGDIDSDATLAADPSVRNFSFTLVDGDIYFRENSRMTPVEAPLTTANRIKAMIDICDCVRALIEYQTEDYDDNTIRQEQEKLNNLYDSFNKKYGLINSRANSSAFSDDSSYCLLCSLEILDENGELVRKADMFFKRTIKQKSVVTSVDTASEALALSLAEKAMVDIGYMSFLTGKTEQEIYEELKGVIFLNPQKMGVEDRHPKYLTADEYLSGNVREKLALVQRMSELYPEEYATNVKALEQVQPADLNASEISVRLGATWIPPEIYQEYLFELLSTPRYCQWNIKVHYSEYTAQWNIEGKSYDRNNIKAYNTYGTNRINAYKIIEETLNLKDVRIFDTVEDGDGKKTQVLNKKETAIAQAKQELIKSEFTEWIWRDPRRREVLTGIYNEKFNSIRPREYNGSHLVFPGMNPEIILRSHQVNAVAHIMYGGNTLLAHEVGAGKTYTMTAAAMESKRIGLCQKSLFVVPNHLTEQWASEFLQLYPSANILVATKKDFETKNRKKFCGRIATGDYDAVIIGHTQFEKIPMSIERQRYLLQQQMDEILDGIADLKRNRGENFTIKQLEKTRKTIQLKIEKLNDQSRKDDVVTFEELGVNRVFVDESHYYKNLFLYTKMRNVGGIAQTEAQKSSDLFMKCRYLDEITDGRGIVFATGTPISNSMVELYTNQRYLQYNTLVKNKLQHFDAWASTFGETVTAIELAPEGTGYRAKTRFAKFYNIPELMTIFKEVADIQTADMLKLPVPEAKVHNISVKPTDMQKDMVAELSERANKVRNKMVDSTIDNMLKITNDGRKLALDQRLINELLPDDAESKVSVCVNHIYEVWEKHREDNLAQLVFCDLSTPHYDDSFNVYDDIRKKLISKEVPEAEIAYIHDADNEVKKKELFTKVRKGQVRVLIGSTQKMGAGTNVQDKLIALHHLDCRMIRS